LVFDKVAYTNSVLGIIKQNTLMVIPLTKFTTTKWIVLANKTDQLFIGIGITDLNFAPEK